MKKILALILALTLVFSLAACATTEKEVATNDTPATTTTDQAASDPAANEDEQPAEDQTATPVSYTHLSSTPFPARQSYIS